jgi:hypothetical protein
MPVQELDRKNIPPAKGVQFEGGAASAIEVSSFFNEYDGPLDIEWVGNSTPDVIDNFMRIIGPDGEEAFRIDLGQWLIDDNGNLRILGPEAFEEFYSIKE